LFRVLRNTFQTITGYRRQLKPQRQEALQKLGHRSYIGGMWEEIGRLQFDFLLRQGLQPSHCLLDIGCGSFRGGVHFIAYLGVGNYLGIDKEQKLIELGIEKELGNALYEEKKPQLVVSDNFTFERFSKKPQFSVAQSLFTHLTPEDIFLCLANLRRFVEPNHLLFATFLEGQSSPNPETSHSLVAFKYTKEEMVKFGESCGWKAVYIGHWNHPRHQMIMKYEAV
jgi:SAM-dependent methyltransferase